MVGVSPAIVAVDGGTEVYDLASNTTSIVLAAAYQSISPNAGADTTRGALLGEGSRASPVLVRVALVAPPDARAEPLSQREGRVTIARGHEGATPRSNADAVFASSLVSGPVVGIDGPCTVHERAPTAGLSAGTITIQGTVTPITLVEAAQEFDGHRSNPSQA